MTDRRGHDGLSWTPSSHIYVISSADLFITLDGRYDGSSQAQWSVEGLRSKHLNSWNLGTGTTSLIFMTYQQDGPSWLRRSVTHSVTPHLVRISHLPSAGALRCHLRTVTSTKNRHKLCRWNFSVFLAQPPHSSFRQIFCK